MKRILGILLIAVLVSGSSVFAQKDYKFGHINSNELLSLMPERDSARTELQDYSQMLQQEMEAMQVELQNKYAVFVEKQDSYSDLVRQSKETELQEMNQRIQGFQQTAQQDLQQKEAELFQPIMDKAQAAIEATAKANGFSHVFDISAGGLIYFSDKSIDILPIVKKELGIE